MVYLKNWIVPKSCSNKSTSTNFLTPNSGFAVHATCWELKWSGQLLVRTLYCSIEKEKIIYDVIEGIKAAALNSGSDGRVLFDAV